MALSLQDKLALALTSAGSQRALAKLVGVSHQKIGRWLREGEPPTIDPTTGYTIHGAGAKQIPEEFKGAINLAFHLHKEVSRDQAAIDKLPFNERAPTFDYRGIMRTGEKGERVITDNTRYIKPELRTDILEAKQKSKKYLQASIRSTVNIKRYFQRVAAEEIERTGRKRTTPAKLGKQIMDSFHRRHGKILADDELMPLYTRYENISPGTDPRRSVDSITRQMRQKHEPHAVAAADEFLFQLMPQKRGKSKAKPKKR